MRGHLANLRSDEGVHVRPRKLQELHTEWAEDGYIVQGETNQVGLLHELTYAVIENISEHRLRREGQPQVKLSKRGVWQLAPIGSCMQKGCVGSKEPHLDNLGSDDGVNERRVRRHLLSYGKDFGGGLLAEQRANRTRLGAEPRLE